MLNCDQTIPYDTKKLVTYIHDLLDKQNSKCNIVNNIVNNNGSNSQANFLSILTNSRVLKIIAILLAFIVTGYLLAPYFYGDSGFFKGKPKPKNQCDAKDINEKSNDHELPNPNVPDHDDALQPVERQEDHGHEIPVQATQEILPEVPQTNQNNAPASDKIGLGMVQGQQTSSGTCVERISVNYELREETQQRVASVIRICPDFVEPPHVDISLRATGGAAANEPIETRKLREIVDERISTCERLLNSEQLRKK
jgi:hypothetical protein